MVTTVNFGTMSEEEMLACCNAFRIPYHINVEVFVSVANFSIIFGPKNILKLKENTNKTFLFHFFILLLFRKRPIL